MRWFLSIPGFEQLLTCYSRAVTYSGSTHCILCECTRLISSRHVHQKQSSTATVQGPLSHKIDRHTSGVERNPRDSLGWRCTMSRTLLETGSLIKLLFRMSRRVRYLQRLSKQVKVAISSLHVLGDQNGWNEVCKVSGSRALLWGNMTRWIS